MYVVVCNNDVIGKEGTLVQVFDNRRCWNGRDGVRVSFGLLITTFRGAKMFK
jgi:hypothetical protein